MPRYRDPSTGKSFRSDAPLSDAELEEAFGGAAGPSGWAGAGAYLKQRGQQFVGALQGVGQDISNVISGQPYGTGFPEERTPLGTAVDVAQTFGPPIAIATAPVAGPLTMGAGLVAGAATRAGGESQETAEDVETLTNLALGAATTLGKGATAISRARAAASARFEAIKQAAIANGRELTTTQGTEFARDLALASKASWATPKDVKAAKLLVDKFKTTGAITYEDLDDAKALFQKVKDVSHVRGMIKEAMDTALQGTPEGAALQAARTRWGNLIVDPKSWRWMQRPVAGGVAGAVGRAGAGYAGAKKIYEGDFRRGAGLLAGALLAGRSPAQLGVLGETMAAPAARTAVLGLGSPTARQMTGPAAPGAAPEEEVPGAAPEEEAAPSPSLAAPGRPAAPQAARPRTAIDAIAGVVGIPPELYRTVIAQESGGRPNVWSHPQPGQAQTPAYGLMQITPRTFELYRPKVEELIGRKASLGNPLDNLVAGGLIWRHYLDLTNGDVEAAARLYHGGPNLSWHGPRTQQYGQDILHRFAENTGG